MRVVAMFLKNKWRHNGPFVGNRFRRDELLQRSRVNVTFVPSASRAKEIDTHVRRRHIGPHRSGATSVRRGPQAVIVISSDENQGARVILLGRLR